MALDLKKIMQKPFIATDDMADNSAEAVRARSRSMLLRAHAHGSLTRRDAARFLAHTAPFFHSGRSYYVGCR